MVGLGPALQFLKARRARRAPAFGKLDLPWPVESQGRGSFGRRKGVASECVEIIAGATALAEHHKHRPQGTKLHGQLGVTAGDGFPTAANTAAA